MEEMKRYLEYDLQWFAKDGPGGEKTEPATAKKLRDAREEGKVAKSRELNFAMDLIALFLVLKVFISYVGKGFLEEFSAVYNKMPEIVKGNGQGMSIHAADQLFRMSIIESIKHHGTVFSGRSDRCICCQYCTGGLESQYQADAAKVRQV